MPVVRTIGTPIYNSNGRNFYGSVEVDGVMYKMDDFVVIDVFDEMFTVAMIDTIYIEKDIDVSVWIMANTLIPISETSVGGNVKEDKELFYTRKFESFRASKICKKCNVVSRSEFYYGDKSVHKDFFADAFYDHIAEVVKAQNLENNFSISRKRINMSLDKKKAVSDEKVLDSFEEMDVDLDEKEDIDDIEIIDSLEISKKSKTGFKPNISDVAFLDDLLGITSKEKSPSKDKEKSPSKDKAKSPSRRNEKTVSPSKRKHPKNTEHTDLFSDFFSEKSESDEAEETVSPLLKSKGSGTRMSLTKRRTSTEFFQKRGKKKPKKNETSKAIEIELASSEDSVENSPVLSDGSEELHIPKIKTSTQLVEALISESEFELDLDFSQPDNFGKLKKKSPQKIEKEEGHKEKKELNRSPMKKRADELDEFFKNPPTAKTLKRESSVLDESELYDIENPQKITPRGRRKRKLNEKQIVFGKLELTECEEIIIDDDDIKIKKEDKDLKKLLDRYGPNSTISSKKKSSSTSGMYKPISIIGDNDAFKSHKTLNNKQRKRKLQVLDDYEVRSSTKKRRVEDIDDSMKDFIVEDDIILTQYEDEPILSIDNIMSDSSSDDYVQELPNNHLKSYTFDEAFDIYLQYLLSCRINPDFYIKEMKLQRSETFLYFKQPIQKIEDEIFGKKEALIRSSAWNTKFLNDLNSLPFYYSSDKKKDIFLTCQACSRKNTVCSFDVSLEGSPYDSRKLWAGDLSVYDEQAEKERTSYMLGSHCHKRTELYHKLHHYKFHLVKTIEKKLDEFPLKASRDKVIDTVLSDKDWTSRLFRDFKSLATKASTFGIEETEGYN